MGWRSLQSSVDYTDQEPGAAVVMKLAADHAKLHVVSDREQLGQTQDFHQTEVAGYTGSGTDYSS